MSVSIDGSGSITGIDLGFNISGGLTVSGVSTTADIHVTGGVQVGTGATINGSTNTITALTTGSERLRITSDGNVGIATDATGQQVMLSVFGDGTGSKKPATIYQNPLTGTGSGNGFYVGINHNDQVGYVWNYEPHALSFATNNTARMGITSEGYLSPAPSGMVIRSGFYGTGYGSGARTYLSSPQQTWTVANINGTNAVLHNIGKFSDDGLTYNKVSSNSHLNICVSFPWYMSPSLAGFGVRTQFSIDGGSNYYTLGGLANGVADYWGAGGYGGNATSDASTGVFSYTYNTRMNTSRASSILSHTGECRLYFEVAIWNINDQLYFIDYGVSNPKTGTITIQEIAE